MMLQQLRANVNDTAWYWWRMVAIEAHLCSEGSHQVLREAISFSSSFFRTLSKTVGELGLRAELHNVTDTADISV